MTDPALMPVLDQAKDVAGIATGYRKALLEGGFPEGWADVLAGNLAMILQGKIFGREM